MLVGGPCQIENHTKSLGMVTDNQLPYRQHADAAADKAN